MIHLLLPVYLWASLLSGPINGSTLQLDWQNQKTSLELVGQGLRSKKIAFIPIKVYDASLYVAQSTIFDRSPQGALGSLGNQKAMAMVLKFRREVEAKQILKSFQEALTANQVSLKAPGIKDFLSSIEAGGAVKEGQTLTLIGWRDANGETLVYENASGAAATFKGSSGFLNQIYSIWLGKTTEAAMEELKTNLLKKP